MPKPLQPFRVLENDTLKIRAKFKDGDGDPVNVDSLIRCKHREPDGVVTTYSGVGVNGSLNPVTGTYEITLTFAKRGWHKVWYRGERTGSPFVTKSVDIYCSEGMP